MAKTQKIEKEIETIDQKIERIEQEIKTIEYEFAKRVGQVEILKEMKNEK